MLCIVFCHCTENTFNMSAEWFQTAPHMLRIVRDLFFTAGRLGVPVFLFLSGYLLLSRHKCRRFDDVLDFYRRKEWPLLRCWLLWIVIYFLIGGAYTQDAWHTLGRQLLLTDQPPYGHVWYMPMIIGIYLGIPLLSMLIEHGGRKLFFLLLALSSFAAIRSSEQCLSMAISGSESTPLRLLDVSFIGDAYVTYILLGYLACLLADKLLSRRRSLLSLAAGCLVCGGIAFLYYQYHKQGVKIGLWYTDWRLIAGTFLLFLGFRCMDAWKSALVTMLSQGAFAIYLMHYPVLSALKKAGVLASSQPWVNTLLLFASTFALSFVLYLGLRRIPFAARYLFLSR